MSANAVGLPTLVSCCVIAAASCIFADDFPAPYDTEPDPSRPQPAEEAAKGFRLPPGFHVSVFASEPDVQNPIACAWDPRGRLWIAENYTYAERAKRFDLNLRDRVVIFADKDGDGRFDERKVFTDDVQMLGSVEVGLGGVWLMCPPNLLFIPDRNRDDVPDGPAEIVLDGFHVGSDNYHTFANGLKFGPDGWLYGRCGASSPGQLGRPGTPEAERVPIAGGIWRYHPRRKVVEVLCHGTTNPWGHDWDENGEMFFINTVNGHLWHMIPGAHYARPHSIDPNRRTYELIDQHADHYHWDTTKTWDDSRSAKGEHDRLGGGHAHVGAMIYLGDNWPAEYRGKLFTLNLHGRRINVDRLEREGSGFVGRHDQDMCFASDPWFRGIDLTYGPDGGVYVLDWSDAGECHESTGVHRRSGRIYKITYGDAKPKPPPDLTRMSPKELVELHTHRNEWFVRQARLLLTESATKWGEALREQSVIAGLAGLADGVKGSAQERLNAQRAFWTMSCLSLHEPRDEGTGHLLEDFSDDLHIFLIRRVTESNAIDRIDSRDISTRFRVTGKFVLTFQRMAKQRSLSSRVALALASALQRLPVGSRPDLAAALMCRREDANDHNLPLLVWYGLIPVGDKYPEKLVELARDCEWPTTRRLIARRLSEDIEKDTRPINDLLAFTATHESVEYQANILQGVSEGLRGWRKARKPEAWDELAAALGNSGDPAVRDRVRDLSVLFGDGRALDDVRKLALDEKAEIDTRRAALQTLIDARPPELREICEKLVSVRYLNATTARGLALFDDPKIAEKLARSYRSFHQTDRPAVLETLVSRPAFARELLKEVQAGKIPRGDLSAFLARQILSHQDEALSKQLAETWGELRESPEDKRKLMAELKSRLTPEQLAKADRSQGRVVFQKTCANCHKLYGQGGEIGPDLTGAGRRNLDYVLENVIDPSATVNAEFRMSIVVLHDGRVLNGLVREETERTLSVWTAEAKTPLDRRDIEAVQPSTKSLMPDGLLAPLTADQTLNLIAYLMHPTQVPLPAAPP